MKPYAIAVSISVTTQEADLSEIKADLRDFLGYECSRAFKVQEKQHPRTWEFILTTIYSHKVNIQSDPWLARPKCENWKTSIPILTSVRIEKQV